MNNQVIEILRGMRPTMHELAETLRHHDDIGYFRPCKLDEKLDDVMKEAQEHHSIVAVRGSVFCIMPVLVDGWVKVPGDIHKWATA